MSFVIAAPEVMAAAATDLANIGSSISAASAAAAGPTMGILAAGADEVSVAISALFGSHAQGYQTLSAQLAAYHNQFVRALNAGVAHTCSNPKRGVALVTATAAPAIAGQRYCEFNGTAWVLIHAVAGIWSHIGGQVSGSAWALGAAMSVANKRPATSIVARINRIGNAPIRAQS